MTSGSVADRIAEALRHGYSNLQERGPNVNEAVTRSVLIERVLEELGYPPTHRSPEDGDRGNRPDDLCYLRPVGISPGFPALVVEAKKLRTDFDQTPPGRARAYSPDRQIQRYLESDKISGPATTGVLTDGIRWRLYQRTPRAAATDVSYFDNFDFTTLADQSQAALRAVSADDRARLDKFVEQLSRAAIQYRTVPQSRPTPVNLADGLFDAVSANAEPDEVLKEMLGEPEAVTSTRIEGADDLTGVRKDAHEKDWESYAVADGPALRVDRPGLDGAPVVVASVKFRRRGSQELSRGDVALCARTLAEQSSSKASVVFAYETDLDGAVSARMATAASGQVNMTASFDPALHSPSARTAIDQQLRLIRDTAAPLNAQRLLSPLAVATLRQQFYREVAQWTARIQQGKDQAGRQAVLRHLIRVMFSWILKEENIIPPEIFELAFNGTNLQKLDDYHRQVLLPLFHDRLNVRHDRRDEHSIPSIPSIRSALDQAPFLNGSLFARQDGDNKLDLQATDYWNADNDHSGLFTILNRYHWTMDEHRPGESEQTLDPELLSNLFERLIVPTEKGGEEPLRQPQGTYYTPADVADEMVKDALSAAVKDHAGPLDDNQLLQLFGSSDDPLPIMSPGQRKRLAGRIRELRIFDPAVGSGEFLFSTLLALQRALKKLDGTDEPAEAIIKHQLRGQDINPLAVQIARLRLFIAITAARKQAPREFGQEDNPLPNLEAVIVCADTLETVADPQWRSAQLDLADPEVAAAVTAIGETRAQWFDAHSEDEKTELLQQHSARRDRLDLLLQQKGELASPELREFVKAELNGHSTARTDARLLFHESPWRGFDIVIGNPPYEALSKSMSKEAVNALKSGKRYQTTNVGDLYSLFCETALTLANPNGGIVTLVVPLSMAFGQQQATLRRIFELRCQKISLRHYDNIPDTIFNGAPTLKTWKNRQRATIITAVLGGATPLIESTGLQGWIAEEREHCLAQRQSAELLKLSSGIDKRISEQWLRIPTKEILDMVKVIIEQSRTVASYRVKVSPDDENPELLAFPETAYQFLGAIPAGSVSPRRENLFAVKDRDTLCLLMAVLNGHVGYGWWWMVGDGFHIKAVADLGFLTIPNIWSANPLPAIEMGRRLIESIPDCITEKMNAGTVWRNVNFHLKPELIAELDRAHISALGLPEEPLLTHLRIMRSSSSWNYHGVQ